MGRDWTQAEIDAHQEYCADDDGDTDDLDLECSLGPDGQCGQAGSEHCDFCCPNRHSELFAGSAAWRKKHKL